MVENDLITVQVEKEIKALFKYYLELLEQLHLDKEKHEIIRKQILDHSNDSIRQLLQFLSFFDFTVNTERVKSAAQSRVVFKKTIISQPVIL